MPPSRSRDDANDADSADALHGIRRVTVLSLSGAGKSATTERCEVVTEDTLSIDVEDIGTYTLMWTPTEQTQHAAGYTDVDGLLAETEDPEALALAAGFALSEGIIQGLADIRNMAACADTPGVVRMRVAAPEKVVTRRRNVLLTSSCGICGSRDIIDNNAFGLEHLPDTLRMQGGGFARLMEDMRKRQAIFTRTGGTHAAAIFSADGHIQAVAEDLGRHNALDKVIGKLLLGGGNFENCGVLLSSRLSLEMATKAIRAGLQIVAAVGAPTSLAIDVAEHFGLTLCGFVREDRATVFAHPHRLTDLGPAG